MRSKAKGYLGFLVLVTGIVLAFQNCAEPLPDMNSQGRFSSIGPALVAQDFNITEGQTWSLTVERRGPVDIPMPIEWSIEGAANEFAANAGEANFPSGESKLEIVFTASNNAFYSKPKSFVLSIKDLSGQLATISTKITLIDDEEPVQMIMAKSIAGGFQNSCRVVSGAAECWGRNYGGGLGDGTNVQRNSPVPVAGLDVGVTSISAGWYQGCAIQNGALKCWGYNYYGNIGDGSTVNRKAPIQVSGLESDVELVSVGAYHSCVIQRGGLKCWGYNNRGQLGDGTTTTRMAPYSVPGFESGVSHVSTGGWDSNGVYSHTCAVKNGQLFCWGYNAQGQVGDGTLVNKRVPTAVAGMESDVTKVAVNGLHTCAIQRGSLKCWGYNVHGQIGDNTVTSRSAPVTILENGVLDVSLGRNHSCAVLESGVMKCWGYNASGQLGNNAKALSKVPVMVPGLEGGVSEISLGRHHTCAKHQGQLKCWGHNSFGQVGVGNATAAHLTPQPIN